MSKKTENIDTTKSSKPDEDKDKKKDNVKAKDDKGTELSSADVKLLKRYGKGPYNDDLKKCEDEIKNLNQKITSLCGIKESDTGLALPAQWNLNADQQMLKQDPALQVGRCTKILNPGTAEAKYIVTFKHLGKFVVGLD